MCSFRGDVGEVFLGEVLTDLLLKKNCCSLNMAGRESRVSLVPTGLLRSVPQKRYAAASDAGGRSMVARSSWLAPMRAVDPLDLPHSPGADQAITQGDKLRGDSVSTS